MSRSLRAALLSLSALGYSAAAGEAVDFERQIKPLLERSCVQCHGPEKQKGKLRLDTAEAMAKGGENGPPVTSGQPEASDFYRRVVLDAGHDDVMPPKGKVEHLSAAETDLVKRWIADGGMWPAGVTAIAMKAAGSATSGPVATPGEMAARTELAKLGVRVRPLANGMNWTRVSFRNVTAELPPMAWEQLRQLTTAVELDLASLKMTDEPLANIAGLSNLTALNLSQTAVTDAGLDHLTRLPNLTTLNLYGTAITDAGLAKLAALPKLHLVYVASTAVTGAGVAALRVALPAVSVEDGSAFTRLTERPPAQQTAVPEIPAKAP